MLFFIRRAVDSQAISGLEGLLSITVKIPAVTADVELLMGTSNPDAIKPWEVINNSLLVAKC